MDGLTAEELYNQHQVSEHEHMCTVCDERAAIGQSDYMTEIMGRHHTRVAIVPLCSAYLCEICDLTRWINRHGF